MCSPSIKQHSFAEGGHSFKPAVLHRILCSKLSPRKTWQLLGHSSKYASPGCYALGISPGSNFASGKVDERMK